MSLAGGLTFELVQLAQQIAALGYDSDQEKEADLFALIYFLHKNKDSQVIVSVLKKLRTGEHSTKFADESAWSSDHPNVKDRMFLAQNVKFKGLEQVTFDGYTKDDELLFTANFHSECFYDERSGAKKTRLFCEIYSTAVLSKAEKITGLQIQMGNKYYEFLADDKTFVFPLDSVGVSFAGKFSNVDLSEGDFKPTFRGLAAAKLVRRAEGQAKAVR